MISPLSPRACDPLSRAAGREERSGLGSVGNVAEVEIALGLYRKLRGSAPPGSLRGRVAVISPYREQRDAIRAAFSREFGEAAASAEAAIDTIDGFQARLLEIRKPALSLFARSTAARASGVW